MTTIYMDTQKHAETQQLIKSLVDGEISRLELALSIARQQLLPFEEKYGLL